jgi:hypothetical protein
VPIGKQRKKLPLVVRVPVGSPKVIGGDDSPIYVDLEGADETVARVNARCWSQADRRRGYLHLTHGGCVAGTRRVGDSVRQVVATGERGSSAKP